MSGAPMKTERSNPWAVVDGYYPGFRELHGASFKVSVVMSATDLDLDTAMKREDDLQLMASAPALRDEVAALRLQLTASESLLALTNDALAACQAQAAGKIRELEARLRAARYDDEIDDGDMSDDEQDGHCDCGALHSEGTEESDSGQCSACGGAI